MHYYTDSNNQIYRVSDQDAKAIGGLTKLNSSPPDDGEAYTYDAKLKTWVRYTNVIGDVVRFDTKTGQVMEVISGHEYDPDSDNVKKLISSGIVPKDLIKDNNGNLLNRGCDFANENFKLDVSNVSNGVVINDVMKHFTGISLSEFEKVMQDMASHTDEIKKLQDRITALGG